VKFCAEIDHKHTYEYCGKNFLVLTIISSIMSQKLEVMYDSFNEAGICTPASGNYAQR
jgi:hypothetical protein